MLQFIGSAVFAGLVVVVYFNTATSQFVTTHNGVEYVGSSVASVFHQVSVDNREEA